MKGYLRLSNTNESDSKINKNKGNRVPGLDTETDT